MPARVSNWSPARQRPSSTGSLLEVPRLWRAATSADPLGSSWACSPVARAHPVAAPATAAEQAVAWQSCLLARSASHSGLDESCTPRPVALLSGKRLVVADDDVVAEACTHSQRRLEAQVRALEGNVARMALDVQRLAHFHEAVAAKMQSGIVDATELHRLKGAQSEAASHVAELRSSHALKAQAAEQLVGRLQSVEQQLLQRQACQADAFRDIDAHVQKNIQQIYQALGINEATPPLPGEVDALRSRLARLEAGHSCVATSVSERLAFLETYVGDAAPGAPRLTPRAISDLGRVTLRDRVERIEKTSGASADRGHLEAVSARITSLASEVLALKRHSSTFGHDIDALRHAAESSHGLLTERMETIVGARLDVIAHLVDDFVKVADHRKAALERDRNKAYEQASNVAHTLEREVNAKKSLVFELRQVRDGFKSQFSPSTPRTPALERYLRGARDDDQTNGVHCSPRSGSGRRPSSGGRQARSAERQSGYDESWPGGEAYEEELLDTEPVANAALAAATRTLLHGTRRDVTNATGSRASSAGRPAPAPPSMPPSLPALPTRRSIGFD